MLPLMKPNLGNRFVPLALAAILSAGTAAAQQPPGAAPPAAQAAGSAASGARAPSRGQAIEGVAALVNDDVVSYSDVRNRTSMMLLSVGGQPDDEIIQQAAQQALESLIEEKIQVQEFKKLAKDSKIGDDEIDQRIAALARQNNQSTEAFLSNLTSRGISTLALREQIRADISWNALIRGRFARNIRVSELRVKEMLDRVKANLNQPQFRVAEIFLYAPDAASQENAVTRASTLSRQIQQGAPFDQVAQQFSAAPSASAGGDLGWLSPGDMRPEFANAIQAAPTAPSILPPIQTEGGVYLIALLGKREPSSPGEAIVDLKQVSASGAGAAEKLAQVRTKAARCEAVAAGVDGIDGVTVNDLKGLSVAKMSPDIKSAVEPLDVGGVTAVMKSGDDQMLLYVCAKASGNANEVSEENIRDRLFGQELTNQADRYLRDLKREATIIRR
jgi:peptidyl-prolyl cis-trans isomerase SurA